MKHNMYSVFDEAARAYLPPFILHTDAMAARVFGDCVNSKEHQFGAHPEHYSLFRIGQFDDGLGSVESIHPSTLVTTGLLSRVLPAIKANGDFDLSPSEEALFENIELKGGDL